jgi:hypothetical protein
MRISYFRVDLSLLSQLVAACTLDRGTYTHTDTYTIVSVYLINTVKHNVTKVPYMCIAACWCMVHGVREFIEGQL